jgi:TM2 domain-containing membrane protein YozV
MGLKKTQTIQFDERFDKEKKSVGAAIAWCLFTGGIGGHRYYLKQTGLGILYTALCWTTIPGIIAVVELFLLKKRVNTYNLELAKRILLTV